MLLPSDLRSRLTQNYASSLPAHTRRKLAELLVERRSLEIRNQAIESLIAFTEYTFRKYRAAAFHKTVAGQLERVERGEVDRLMLLLPPRHGKSELASKRFLIRVKRALAGCGYRQQGLQVTSSDSQKPHGFASDPGRWGSSGEEAKRTSGVRGVTAGLTLP